jgi:hypothetical protein
MNKTSKNKFTFEIEREKKGRESQEQQLKNNSLCILKKN